MGAYYSDDDPRKEEQDAREEENGGSFDEVVSISPASSGEATQKAIRKPTQTSSGTPKKS